MIQEVSGQSERAVCQRNACVFGFRCWGKFAVVLCSSAPIAKKTVIPHAKMLNGALYRKCLKFKHCAVLRAALVNLV